jgi:hypothetical protein
MRRVRLIAWNVNHRQSDGPFPEWVDVAITTQHPDVVVLTEYVEGPSHARLVSALDDEGLYAVEVSSRENEHNQVLIAAREPLRRGGLLRPEPPIEYVPSNVLHVVLERSNVDVIGFRLPSFSKPEHRGFKRATWNWLLREAAKLRNQAAIIAGDFNTAPGDSVSYCGDCLEELSRSGWDLIAPSSGHSWRGPSRLDRKIDHVFVTPPLGGTSRYVWDYQSLAQEAASGKVGIPDHAMLVAELEPVNGLTNRLTKSDYADG